MNKFLDIFSKYRILIIGLLLVVLLSALAFWRHKVDSRYYINAKFMESGPLYKNMPVCFKGYRIGYTKDVRLSDDYQYTLVKIVLYPKNPKIPANIEAVVKKHDVLRNYIDLVSPEEEPTKEILKRGETVDGRPLFEIGTFLSEIADSGLLIPLLQNFSDTALSLNSTSTKIGGFFTDSSTILKDNRKNIKQSTKNLATTSKSIVNLSNALNNAITEEKINKIASNVDKSATNIQKSTENVKHITQNVDSATKNLGCTMSKIDSTVADTKEVASNAKFITCGVRETLNKRFAGFRIFFGKTIDNRCIIRKCSK